MKLVFRTLTVAVALGKAMTAQASDIQLQAANVIGKLEVVFDTKKDSCEQKDIPDTNPRAFRDHQNKVHLFSSHYIARGMVGDTLNSVKQDCRPVFNSSLDKAPEHFADYDWFGALYTEDGTKIFALMHNEYHGWAHPGMCERKDIKVPGHCWWNVVDLAVSNDGGRSFSMQPAPQNLVASAPFRYDPKTTEGAVGFYGPSNIIRVKNYYYALINTWRNKIQPNGACLIRSEDLSDPKSWRAWNGSDFGVSFGNPYEDPAIEPASHVCKPVYGGTAQGFFFHPESGAFLISEMTPDKRYGDPGLYLSTSTDMIHWQHPVLVKSINELNADAGKGRWRYDYFSLLDPASTDRSFSTITNKPYAYFVRLDLEHAPYTRILYRMPLELKFSNK